MTARVLLLVAAVAVTAAGCHKPPRRLLTKADLDGVYAQMYGPHAPTAADIAGKLGPPARITGGRSIWRATDGGTCWTFWISNGTARPALFSLDPKACE